MNNLFPSGSASVFLRHGTVHDLAPVRATQSFVSLDHDLASPSFEHRDTVLSGDRGSETRFLAPNGRAHQEKLREDGHKMLDAIDLANDDLTGADNGSLLVQCVRRAAIEEAPSPGAAHMREIAAPHSAPERLRARLGSPDEAEALERGLPEPTVLLR